MKRLGIGLLVALFSVSSLNPIFAAIRSGTPCPKLKMVANFAGYKYTCVRSGKKLIWSKGIVISQTQTSSQSPAPKPVLEPERTLPEKSIYRIAKLKTYNAIRSAADSGSAENISLVLHVGESFPTDLKNLYLKQVDYASRLYSSFFSKKEIINIYLYTEKDASVIKADPNLNFNYSDFDRWFKSWSEGKSQEHNIGLASYYLLRNSPPQGHAGLAVFSGASLNSIRLYGIQVMPHEYWHIVQDYYMQSGRGVKFSDQDSYDLFFPPTFREGSANTISFALASNSFEEYLKLYNDFVTSKKTDLSMEIFKSLKNEQDVVKVLESIEVRSKNPEAHEASYLLGQLLYEWVIAEYGFEGYRKLILNQLMGSNFEDNLKASLGVEKSELYKKAAGHILAAFNE